MNIDVLILYEHLVRELETSLLLKKILRDLGYRVETRSLPYEFWDAQKELRPRLVLSPWSSRRLLHLRNPEGRLPMLFDLHQEQIGIESEQSLKRPTEPFGRFYHAAWGERFREGLVSYGVKKDHVFLTGFPRLDFYRHELRSLSFSRNEIASMFGLDAEKKWILFVSSFSGADSNIVDCKRHISHGFSKVREISIESQKHRKATVEFLYVLASQLPGFQLIYRPHPSESSDITSNRRGAVRVIRELDIRNWFLASDLALIWNSTSCIEALQAEIPFFKVRIKDLDPEYEMLSMRSVPILGKDRVVEVLEQCELMERKSFFRLLSSSYDKFRKETDMMYSRDKFAILETVKAVTGLLDDEKDPVDPFYSYEYPSSLVAIERLRVKARDAAIRTGILPSFFRSYEIKKNDLPSNEKEEEFMEMLDKNDQVQLIPKMLRDL